MLKKALSFALLVLFPLASYADLKKVISIGSDDLNYRFFVVTAAVMDEQNNVYVCDSKGSFLRKYDAGGRFLKETGRYGQGPGEFSNAISDLYLEDNLFVLDNGNSRIVELDKELNINKYIKLNSLAISLMKFGDVFYMVSRKAGNFNFEIGIYDRDGNYLRSFFDQSPSFIKKIEQTKIGFAISLIYSSITAAIDRETGEIAVTFQWPGEKIEIFIYSKDGQFIKKVEADHLIKYNFPEFRLKGLQHTLKFPDRSNLIMARKIYYLNRDRLLLEYWVSEYNADKEMEEKEYILIIDKNSGRLVHKEILPFKVGITDVRGNYICAISDETEAPKVIIFKLDY